MGDPDQLTRLYDEMAERCEMVWLLRLNEGAQDGAAVGALILNRSHDLLVVEATISEDGDASVTVRAFDPDMESRQPNVIELGDEIMISAVAR